VYSLFVLKKLQSHPMRFANWNKEVPLERNTGWCVLIAKRK